MGPSPNHCAQDVPSDISEAVMIPFKKWAAAHVGQQLPAAKGLHMT